MTMKKQIIAGLSLALVWAIALAATYSDAFPSDTGANAGCGANWSHYSEGSASTTGRQVVSGVCTITASFTARTVQWNGGAVGNDQYSEVTLTSGTADYNEGVAVRMSADTFYTCRRLSDSSLRLARSNAGSLITLDTQSATLTTPVTLRIEISGSNITCKVGGSTVIGPYTDGTPIASGQPGFYSANNAGFDNWSGGDLGGGGGGSSITAIFRHLRQMKQ
jgi:hypothetical protein